MEPESWVEALGVSVTGASSSWEVSNVSLSSIIFSFFFYFFYGGGGVGGDL